MKASRMAVLANKVAVVTGASSGIGAHFARALADAGADVIAVARRLELLEVLAKQHERIHPARCDVTDSSARERLVREVLDAHGCIDVLVNNAGITNIAPAEDEAPETFRHLLDVNLVAPFALAHLVAPSMLTRGDGTVVNVASIVGLVGIGRMPQAGYAASKGGLVSLTRELAAQWARRGIRVNAIAPGFFPTEMTHGLFESEKGQDWVGRLTPMGRGGALDELTAALLYLVDPTSSYTTGTVMAVDGGWTAV